MATVLHRTTLELIESAHTPDYDPADWLVNPDLSAVAGLPRRYWKVVGDDVLPMDASEMAQVDAEIADLAAAVRGVTLVFSAAGRVHDEWLGLGGDGRSNDTPWFAHVDLVLSLFGWSCREIGGGATVELHVGSAVATTWSPTTRFLSTTLGVGSVSVPAGSPVSVRVTAATGDVRDPAVWLVLREVERLRQQIAA